MLWKSNEQHCHIVVVIKKGKVWKVKNVKEGWNRKDLTRDPLLYRQCVIWFCLFKMKMKNETN